ncbi:MAG: SDR family NAD(P)-dependent oxidoreductase [Deltaproteobacteria bacterium]|jgi:NAD(P)-dependent dehydrogenase (short-subunit alcohol dehydrogenase family)|nr:SDR family NAD(P)-dependent oxidoreductase [Deltaproteobacteria bacterium]
MDLNLKRKTALITGSGKKTGIGYAIAKKFASRGCNIIIADYGAGKDLNADLKTGSMGEMQLITRELQEDYGVKTLAVHVDVTDSEEITKMICVIREQFDTIDILCNNAGATFGVPNGIHTYDEDAWLRTVDVNLHGVFRMSKAIVPLMQEKGGNIVNTASRAGKVPALFNGAYSVAKAGVIMLTKVMAKELAGLNIRVNAICPGQIMTDLEKWRFEQEAKFFNTSVEEQEQKMCNTIPVGRIGSPEEVGELALFLASDASSYITGQALNICGGQLMEL